MSSILARASSAYRTATKRYAPALFLRSLLRRETRRIQAMAQIENAPFETERQRLLTVDAKAGDEPIESGSIETLVGGSLRTIRREEQRRHLLNPVIEEIDKLLADNRSISIYEPGCGHAYNLILLKNAMGTA